MFGEINNKAVYYDFASLQNNPMKMLLFILDIICVALIFYGIFKIVRKSRAWQSVKGIAFLVIITLVSGWLNLKILNFILSSIMTYGVILLIIIFLPELRRSLSQIGANTKIFNSFLGLNKGFEDKLKENIYKVIVAVNELARTKTGALIVFERDISLQDIKETGIDLNADVSPQILVNIFIPNTPLHDGAVVISQNKISSAACILPLSDDKNISKELGTRHRAAIGMSKESDALVIVISEETGRISITKDGKLYQDFKEDEIKEFLIKNLITDKSKDNKNKE